MPTKAEQSRINGAKSTGPKTPEGLQRCRQASVKHGMWVAHVSTLGHEEQLAYAAIYTSANDQFHPRSCFESAVVGLLADAIWRATRLGALANSDIDREMWVIKNQSNVDHDADELHLLAEQASKSVQKLEARARHYTREVARLMDILKKLQSWPVSTEASQMLNEIIELRTEDVPEPPAQEAQNPAKPAVEPLPARKPVQSYTPKAKNSRQPLRR